jgi:membrane protein
MLDKIIRFITVDIWRLQIAGFSRKKSILIRQLRIIILALRGFDEDRCFLRASSLTFYFLFSIVPLLAMVFGIAKGFGIEKVLEEQIMQKFQGQEEIIAQLIQFSHTFLQQTKGGIIAGLGIVLLIWTVIRVLSNIENSFNEIWGIKKGRSLGRKFSDYLAIIFICPVLLVVPGSITILVAGYLKTIMEKFPVLSTLGPLVMLSFKLAPYIIIWLVFSFLYSFMPNTKVKLKAAILGGVVAGTIYQVVQWGYINFQVGAARYGAIYGSFAAVPLFLAWIQISWLIVLFGAEISFAYQNVETYEFERDCLQISHSFKNLISLRIAHLIIKNFSSGGESLTASQISRKLEVPIRLVNDILYELVESEILAEVKKGEKSDLFYHPARDPEILTVKYIVDALEESGSHNIPIVKSEELNRIAQSLKTFSDITEKSPANIPLKNI